MAFKHKDLRLLVNGYCKIWNYWTDDSAITISSRGYFENATALFGVGDWIYATTCTGGVILHVIEINPLELEKIGQRYA